MNESSSLPAGSPTEESVYCAACGRQAPKQETILLGEAHYCARCKPQVLQRLSEGKPLASSKAEEVRKNFLAHEASVKSIGLLYYLGGAGVALMLISVMIRAFSNAAPRPTTTVLWRLSFGALLLGLAVGQVWVGVGLRRLQAWARIPCGILSGIGLLAFPIGTIVNAYVLYLVFSKKGQTVFSPGYQLVIQETPHIKYKTSIVVWIFLGLLVLIFLIVGLAVVLDRGAHR